MTAGSEGGLVVWQVEEVVGPFSEKVRSVGTVRTVRTVSIFKTNNCLPHCYSVKYNSVFMQ